MKAEDIERLHNDAMDKYDAALLAETKGNHVKARDLFLLALESEETAALASAEVEDLRTSAIILLRSAATIAIRAAQFERAELIIARGMLLHPSEPECTRLRIMLKEIGYQIHWARKGVFVPQDHMQVVCDGLGVGYGSIRYELLQGKQKSTLKLVHRITEHEQAPKDQPAQKVPRAILAQLQPFSQASSPGSYSFVLRFGAPVNQQLNLLWSPCQAIEATLDFLEIFNCNDEEKLRNRYGGNERFLEVATGLANEILPDGDELNRVDFHAVHRGRPRKVSLTRTRSTPRSLPKAISIREVVSEQPVDGEIRALTGRLAGHDHSRIDDDATIYIKEDDSDRSRGEPVIVSRALYQDVVRDYIDQHVSISVKREGNKWRYLDIVSSDD